MRIESPPPHTADAPGLRGLWPLVAGPLILGGVIFWVAFFVHIARGISQRLEVRWQPLPPAASDRR